MEALRGLVDYAGLFPPAQLDLRQATDEYRSARAGPHAWMLGRFIVPLSVLSAHTALLQSAPLSVIVDGGPDPATWSEGVAGALVTVARLRDRGLEIELLEVPVPAAFGQPDAAIDALRRLRETLHDCDVADLATYVELPRGSEWNELLERVLPEMTHLGLRAKLRCGGIAAAAFPSVDEVAAFVEASARSGVPFKATAGLHHPVRHRDAATGFLMHGFLNLIAAATFASNVDSVTSRAIVAEEDLSAFALTGDGLRWRDRVADVASVTSARRDRFVSYGSCSFDEPVDDLIALGVLSK